MKFNRNSVPIVGTVEKPSPAYSTRWSAPTASTAMAPTTSATEARIVRVRVFMGIMVSIQKVY